MLITENRARGYAVAARSAIKWYRNAAPPSRLPRTPREEALTEPIRRANLLDLLADFFGLPVPLCEKEVHLLAVAQVVGKHSVNVGQFERRKLALDFLWRATQLESTDQRFESDPRPHNAHRAVRLQP